MKTTEYRMLADQNMNANRLSDGVDLGQMALASVQAIHTGSPVGTISLEGSNDGTNYTVITGSSTSISGVGSVLINISYLGWQHLRVRYTRTSGSGNLNVYLYGKG